MTEPEQAHAMEILQGFLREGSRRNASDIHLAAGAVPALRLDGCLEYMDYPKLTGALTQAMFAAITSQRQQLEFAENTELDFAYMSQDKRFRINAFKQQGTVAMAIRLVNPAIRSLEELGLPAILGEMARRRHGLLLITGTTGSGKSTTLAAVVDLLNRTQALHIITLEDPVEYVHEQQRSIVNQREAGMDFISFAGALRSALREDPDVIMVGELRDRETVQTALTAAETGHLILGTLHTSDAVEAVLRIESMFPAYQQEQVRLQLSLVLQGIAAQQLLPRKEGPGRVCAVEILNAVPAIRNLIREGKPQQIFSQLQTGRAFGMRTMDAAIKELQLAEKITPAVAKLYCQRGLM